MAIRLKQLNEKEFYLVSGNGIIRTVPSGGNFLAYRKTERGDFELKPEGGKINEEVMEVVANSLTLVISEKDYYNKTIDELNREYALQ